MLPSVNVTVPVGVPLAGEMTLTVAENVTVCPQTAGFADAVTAVALEATLTTWGDPESLPLLERKLPSPLYEALIVWVPRDSDEVVNVALAELLRATVAARVVDPSVKVTVPVAVPPPGEAAVTVAVKVMTWPNAAGLADEVSVDVLEVLFTTWGAAESLALLVKKLLSPL